MTEEQFSISETKPLNGQKCQVYDTTSNEWICAYWYDEDKDYSKPSWKRGPAGFFKTKEDEETGDRGRGITAIAWK